MISFFLGLLITVGKAFKKVFLTGFNLIMTIVAVIALVVFTM